MEKQLKDILPVLGIEQGAILSKQGAFTLAFRLTLPEVFTLSDEDHESLHQAWVKAIRVLPKNSVLHKQDWFLKKQLNIQQTASKRTFLSEASDRYFSGREYLHHDCLVYLTRQPQGRRPATSLFSNLIRPTLVPRDVLGAQAIREFRDIATQFKRLLEDTRLISVQQLGTEELQSQRKKAGLIERYCFLAENDEQQLYRDISFEDTLKIGNRQVDIYTLGDTDSLPSVCGPRLTYGPYSTDQTRFPVSFASRLGLLLNCSHIYNQYILVGDEQQVLKQLEKKRLRLQSLSAYSRENAIALDATNDFLNEAISRQRLPVKAHFNVMVWSDDREKLQTKGNQVLSAMAAMDAAAKPETDGAAQIWWSGIPGNAGDFPVNDTFDTFAEQAACFLNMESNYKSAGANEGIRFCDRLSGRPVYADLFDAPRQEGITSNMGTLVCGTSGGGKSMTVNHILRSLYDHGAHCVTVDIGGSYLGLCDTVKGYYFTYTESDPIKFNPFYLSGGEVLDTEKKESLKALLVSLWKGENETFNRAEYVALSNALQGYYSYLTQHSSVFPAFDSFYEYLEHDYREVLKSHRVKESAFDMDNFLYVLRPYYKGGEFDYLLNARENLDLLGQPFIVFELDQIKDHPILFPVVTLIIMELFISKMRKLAGVRKVLTIDEAWKAIARSGMAEFLRYAFKTIRKFNGIPIVITQELEDLVSSPVIKDAIINNADIKILMDMRKFQGKFDKLQDTLGLSDKGKTILLSVNKDHREIFVDIGGQVMKVYKNELCPEEYFAFTTEGKERVKVREYAAQHGSLEAGIAALVAEQHTKPHIL
ncbi:TraG family conjugative transposon ATPase [Mucilaginibacter achroorhodeus]|uniref:TraG family conjugative transposon ATPase n=1 Tax=Mucilaginibacter achroorhodeus TaxID=2599294 RepID=A0A563U677_9SPHI|nr:TraG family conjugative transposon ATPase [Mucilaginibacter achroorhodeus]TWR26824.1 TraG family conjugative transposon ATPase [Mucilaginibacter achroorhodeus]